MGLCDRPSSYFTEGGGGTLVSSRCEFVNRTTVHACDLRRHACEIVDGAKRRRAERELVELDAQACLQASRWTVHQQVIAGMIAIRTVATVRIEHLGRDRSVA